MKKIKQRKKKKTLTKAYGGCVGVPKWGKNSCICFAMWDFSSWLMGLDGFEASRVVKMESLSLPIMRSCRCSSKRRPLLLVFCGMKSSKGWECSIVYNFNWKFDSLSICWSPVFSGNGIGMAAESWGPSNLRLGLLRDWSG